MSEKLASLLSEFYSTDKGHLSEKIKQCLIAKPNNLEDSNEPITGKQKTLRKSK